MLFSEHFEVSIAKPEWFDPILDHDTRLFIDPFLILKVKHSSFKNSHNKIVEFFENVFIQAAKSSRSVASMSHQRLLYLNVFPEVEELCLGYAQSTKGAGSGYGYAKNIVEAIYESIDLGIESL